MGAGRLHVGGARVQAVDDERLGLAEGGGQPAVAAAQVNDEAAGDARGVEDLAGLVACGSGVGRAGGKRSGRAGGEGGGRPGQDHRGNDSRADGTVGGRGRQHASASSEGRPVGRRVGACVVKCASAAGRRTGGARVAFPLWHGSGVLQASGGPPRQRRAAFSRRTCPARVVTAQRQRRDSSASRARPQNDILGRGAAAAICVLPGLRPGLHGACGPPGGSLFPPRGRGNLGAAGRGGYHARAPP